MPKYRLMQLSRALLVALLLQPSLSFQTPALTGRRLNLNTLSTAAAPRRTTVLVLQAPLDEEYPKFSSDVASSKATKKNSKTSTNTNSNSSSSSFVELLNNFGESLKPRAQDVDAQALEATKTRSKFLLKAKASLYWMLYMGYRGYRGFFVILPAVFRETYAKMETTVNFKILDDDDDDDDDAQEDADGVIMTTGISNRNALDVNPSTGKVRWRTKLTVSVLAGFVTLTYVIGGLARVLMKFMKTILKTSSLSGGFSAAAAEVEGNEGRLMKLSDVNGSSGSGVIGGGGKRSRTSRGDNKDIGFN